MLSNDWDLREGGHLANFCMGAKTPFFSNRSPHRKPVPYGNFIPPIDPSQFALSKGAMHGCIA